MSDLVPEEVMAATLEGEAVLLNMETKRYYRLNETGASIWKGLEEGLDREALLARLTGRFEVDSDEAARALDDFLEELDDHDLLAGAP